ncbi:lysozyme inhibitor LprI family protein [Silanimonas sp.]|jgi:uncharacterized protein YecT (DUF1311 family)|uniref:lysozyme inhibitor LprI family protein n=1 Tax=Silanimonas sp. TaxID=1929290 RepID=UPI0037CA3D5E
MRSITRVLLALALVAAAAPGDTAGNPARPDRYEACLDASGGVTVEMLDCAEVELSWLNSRLNGHYGEAMAVLPADQRVALRDLQRAWIRYRDLDCGFLNDQALAGSSGLLLQSSCLIDKTRVRVGAMKDIEARARMLFKGDVAN